MGGYGYQTGDWAKHGILLKDLVDYPWPVFYEYYGATIGVTYYVAYYLPAAVIGKVGGLVLANQFLVLWTLLGLILAIFWFALVINALFETSGCPRGVGCAFSAIVAPIRITLRKINVAFTMSILPAQNCGESGKLRLVLKGNSA